jgi:hypothetical protein
MPDENLPDEGDGIRNLRKQYDELKKKFDERDAALEKYRTAERATQVAELLKAKGVPEGAASLYTGEDTSEAAVTKWLEQYAGVFGVKQEQQANAGAQPVADPNADAARRIAGNAYGNLEGLSAPPTGEPILGDPAEMERFMRTAPIEALQKAGLYPASGTLFNP